MKSPIRILLALALVVALLAPLAAVRPVLADGAASTRNILIGVGAAAATLIIINHNKKLHEKYAEDAAKQAALAKQRDDATAALAAEKQAYQHERAVAQELEKEVSQQHQMIVKQQHELGQVMPQGFVGRAVAKAPTPDGGSRQVALESYGWGTF